MTVKMIKIDAESAKEYSAVETHSYVQYYTPQFSLDGYKEEDWVFFPDGSLVVEVNRKHWRGRDIYFKVYNPTW